jgi:hypothetical protein
MGGVTPRYLCNRTHQQCAQQDLRAVEATNDSYPVSVVILLVVNEKPRVELADVDLEDVVRWNSTAHHRLCLVN